MFFILFFAIYFLGNIFILYRVIHDLNLRGISLTVFLVLYFAAAFLSIYSLKTARMQEPSPSAKILAEIGYIWLGTFSIAVTYLLLSQILFIFNHSQKFMFGTTLATIILIMVSSAYSVINTMGTPKVKEIEIPVKNLQTDKLTIVQLSDIHIDVSTTYDEIKNIVNITNSLNPDIIAFVGDFADIDIKESYDKYGLKELKAKYGVFAVSGNHEYYGSIKRYENICEKLNFVLLDNENVLIDNKFYIAGITDPTSKVFGYKPTNVKRALRGIDFEKPVIFLSHQPQTFSEVSLFPVTLQLSGHTHAGQIPPFDIIEYFIYKYFFGLYKNGNSYIYVTSGTRWWGPPMRLFSKSEIVKITLINE